MLNKKLLAVAVAASLTSGFAHAASGDWDQEGVSLDSNSGEFINDYSNASARYAAELTWGASQVLIENDVDDLDPLKGTPSSLTADIGFTVSEGTSKYIRIDLLPTNAAAPADSIAFAESPALSWTTGLTGANPDRDLIVSPTNPNPPVLNPAVAIPNPQSSIADGGLPGDNYVIFEVTAFEDDPAITEDIPRFLSFFVNTRGFIVNPNASTSYRACYRLYETAVDADQERNVNLLNENPVAGTSPEAGACAEFITFVAATDTDLSVPNNSYASVDTEYTEFVWGGTTYADHDEVNLYDEQQNASVANTNASGTDTPAAATYAGSAASATVANLGYVDADMLHLGAGTAPTVVASDLDGGDFGTEDIVGNDPVLRFFGDFSYGLWTVNYDDPAVAAPDACLDPTDVRNFDPLLSSDTVLTFDTDFPIDDDIEQENWALCIDTQGVFTSDTDDNFLGGGEDPWTGNRIMESTYTTSLSWPTPSTTGVYDWNEAHGANIIPVTADMGSIIYDTITVDVPFLTTFGAYNQRFTLVNNGPTDATYMFTFTPESGVTAANGAAYMGTIPAGESVVLRAADVVTLSGRTRTAATLYIGGEDEDISVASQITNTTSGTIDTSTLNANSVRATKTNMLP